MRYRVVQRYHLFEYNAKRQSHKLKTYEVGDFISQQEYDRLKPSSKANFIEVIN